GTIDETDAERSLAAPRAQPEQRDRHRPVVRAPRDLALLGRRVGDEREREEGRGEQPGVAGHGSLRGHRLTRVCTRVSREGAPPKPISLLGDTSGPGTSVTCTTRKELPLRAS